MSYDKLGKAAIRFAVKYVRRRYRRQIRIGAGVAVAGWRSPPTSPAATSPRADRFRCAFYGA